MMVGMSSMGGVGGPGSASPTALPEGERAGEELEVALESRGLFLPGPAPLAAAGPGGSPAELEGPKPTLSARGVRGDVGFPATVNPPGPPRV